MLRILPFVQKVLPYLKPYRFTFLLLSTQLLVINLCELLKPWPLKLIIDHVLGARPLPVELTQGWAPEALLLAACSGLILIYLLLADRNVEIVADRGIDAKVGAAGWEKICADMETDFRSGNFAGGVIKGIGAVSRQLG